MFKTIDKNVSSEIVEKKSKFIANIYYVETVEEAEEKIKEVKKSILMQDTIVMHLVYIQKKV